MSKPIRRFLALLVLLLASTGAAANMLLSIMVTPVAPELHVDVSIHFTATGTYDDNSTRDITANVTWTSSNPGVVTISNAAGTRGLATAIIPGTTTITATSSAVSRSTTVIVDTAVLVSMAVSPVNGAVAQTETLQFVAEGIFSDASTTDLTDVATWSTGNPAIATIFNAAGSRGLATGIAPGMTTITATYNLVSGSADFNVIALLNSVHVDDGQAYASYGKLVEYMVTLHYDSGTASRTTAVVGTLSAGLDIAQAHWQCISVAGISCAQHGTGALVDSATLSPGESAIWQVTAPVLPNTVADTIEFDVNAAHAPIAADVDLLTLFTNGFE